MLSAPLLAGRPTPAARVPVTPIPAARVPAARIPAPPVPPARSPRPRVFAARQNDAQITDWALAAGGGDREAAEHFVRATYDDVRRFVAHLSADAPGADDLAQETYLRAMSGLARFAGRSCARTWLLSIARRVVIDRHRTAAARPRIADTADWQAVVERAQPCQLPGFDESVAVFDALRSLEPARRQAFALTQLLGLSYEEAAAAAGCPIGTVRSRVARARRDLAVLWSAEPGGRTAARERQGCS
ncbi:sigma-70 family RNA polymerase sigma factor [Streptomyces sp. NBC_01433]|nr:sigma-70 family RNA polymerase sigma factor [Streptomyces sp. NBC_01433]